MARTGVFDVHLPPGGRFDESLGDGVFDEDFIDTPFVPPESVGVVVEAPAARRRPGSALRRMGSRLRRLPVGITGPPRVVPEVRLDFTSMYRGTRMFTRLGKSFFGIWNPPTVVMDGDEEEITVQRGQEGQLDLFAEQVYGDRALWRIIAHVNGIDYAPEQVVVGMRLKMPKPAKVRAALLQGAAETGRVGAGEL